MNVEQIMSCPVRSVAPDLPVRQASEIMQTEGIRRLVVLQCEKPVGIVTQTDVVQVLASHTLSQKVSDAMMKDVIVADGSMCVRDAAELMVSKDISCLVIMDEQAVAGVFTERDFLLRVVASQREPAHTSLEQVKSSPVVTVPSDHSILAARRLLEQKEIRRLVVMKNEAMCGLITQTDIHRVIRAKLQEDEGNYLKLLDGSANCIYAVDLNFITTYVNPAFMRLLGVTEQRDLVSKPFLPEMFWDDPQQRDRTLSLLKGATAEVAEVTLRATDGKKVFATLFSARTRDAKGRINGSQGVLHDITTKKELADLRETQQRLRNSEQLLRATLESTADGILVIDENGRASHVNTRLMRIWDIPEELILLRDNKRLFEHISSKLENGSEFLARLRSPQLSFEESFDLIRLRDGKTLEVHTLPLIQDATVIGHVWNFRDVTERKQAEDDLRLSEGKLDAMLSAIVERERVERELEELNLALEKSVRELDRSNKELQEFAYIAAHDLKTPLRGIGTLVDWLASDYAEKLDEEGRNSLKLLKARAMRMSAMIDGILEYSGLGENVRKRQQVDLAAALREVVAAIDPPDTIQIIAESELPVVTCARIQIVQVLQNLIGNAIKYMDKPAGRIRIGCVEQDGFWKLSVSDNGPGIEEKHSQRIFKMFQTLAPRDASESTGIGLSIVKKIAALNGGKTWVESGLGEGSTFYFTVPKQDADVGCAAEADESQ